MSESNTQVIHRLCTEQADAFAQADDLLPAQYHNNHHRILAACMIAHALDLNPATVMFGLHLKTPPAAQHEAKKPVKPEKPAKPEQDLQTNDWPQLIDGVWIDAVGATYDENKHGWNKAAKMPSVKSDGTFRSGRVGKIAKPKKEQDIQDKKPENHDDEQVMIDANQVLASFKNHITNATTGERLEQLGSQIELMGFTPSELTVARRWIAERAEDLEQA